MQRRWPQLPFLAVLLYFAFNLRSVLLAVSPLLPAIQRDLGLSYTATGLLSNLPLLLMGVLAYPAALVIGRIGPRRSVSVALIVIVSMTLLRGLSANGLMLFATTALLSVGITLGQTTSPTLVRDWFPRHIGQTTAAYSTGLMVGEIAAAAVTVPWVVALVGGGWRGGLLFWTAPAVVALVIWLLLLRRWQPARIPTAAPPLDAAIPAVESAPLPWRQVILGALGMGGGSVMFFGMTTWIPVYFAAIHRADTAIALASLTILQLPSSLALSFWGTGRLGTKGGFIIAGSLAALTMVLWLIAPANWDGWLAGLIGASSAAIFIFGLSLPPLLARGPNIARVSGIMLGLSYTLAFAAPALGGALWDLTGHPRAAFVPIFAAALLVITCGVLIPKVKT